MPILGQGPQGSLKSPLQKINQCLSCYGKFSFAYFSDQYFAENHARQVLCYANVM